MKNINDINGLIKHWNSDEGKPYKGSLIDMSEYDRNPEDLGCMCAQGQVLRLLGGWSPEALYQTKQYDADRRVAKILNISVGHSILLRDINDIVDGAPSSVLTNPKSLLGKNAYKLLALWLWVDGLSGVHKRELVNNTLEENQKSISISHRGQALMAANKVCDRAESAKRITKLMLSCVGCGAMSDEIIAGDALEGSRNMRISSKPFRYLNLAGFDTPDDIPPLPEDYGLDYLDYKPVRSAIL